jgi:hypothetical protein
MPGPCQKNKAAKAEYDRPTASLCWVRMDNIRCENDSAAPADHNETRVLSLKRVRRSELAERRLVELKQNFAELFCFKIAGCEICP